MHNDKLLIMYYNYATLLVVHDNYDNLLMMYHSYANLFVMRNNYD